MKRPLRWTLAVTLIAVVGVTGWRVAKSRQAQQQAAVQAQAAREDNAVELATSDVFTVRTTLLTQGLPVSGALRAVNSAVVKARVAGELQGLTVREGDFVQAGQVIARIDVAEYAARVRQARELAASSRAQLELAQRQYDNNQALVVQGFISATALDTSRGNLNAAQASYQAALAGADVASKSVQDTVLKAPIDGQVSQRLAQPGERVGVDARVIEIVDLRQLELEATFSAADGAQLAVGQTAQLRVDGSEQVFAARLARINPSAQAGSRNVLAYLSITTVPAVPSRGAALRQGLFAQGTLGTVRTEQLALPLSSVRTDKPAAYVQTLQPSAAVSSASTTSLVVGYRAVGLGLRGDAANEPMVAVTGLPEGSQVLRAGVGPLREGTRVTLTTTAKAASAAPVVLSSPQPGL